MFKRSLVASYTLSLILCIECRNTPPMHEALEHISKYSIDLVFLTVGKRTGFNARLPVAQLVESSMLRPVLIKNPVGVPSFEWM